MLTELRVENLGIIDEMSLCLGAGLTVVTGETGAGKTLFVNALELLLGGRAEGERVRDGAAEARVEGRFVDADGEEVVLARAVPATGRSRAYVDGRLATAAELTERGATLVELHGQHTHHALLAPAEQRTVLDQAAGRSVAAPLEDYRDARAEVRRLTDELAGLGGDPRQRARELDLLRFQLDEIDGAAVDGPGEDDALEARELLLADAAGHRDALDAARSSIDEHATDAVGLAAGALSDRAPFRELAGRVRAAQGELADLARELRLAAESIEVDPDQLAQVRERRRRLRELERKYGDDLTAVLAYADGLRARITELEAHDSRSASLDRARDAARARADAAAAALTRARRDAAPLLTAAVTERLGELGMPGARFEIGIEPAPAREDGADAVTFLLAANRGDPPRPLAKVASGGELARAMLALRVVLATDPGASRATALVFDEVDAGLGGEAGRAVGRALALLARTRPVLCVTHLAQVAACADTHVVVDKHAKGGRTVARATIVIDEARVGELSRMLAGVGESRHARRHAEELLADAGRAPARAR